MGRFEIFGITFVCLSIDNLSTNTPIVIVFGESVFGTDTYMTKTNEMARFLACFVVILKSRLCVINCLVTKAVIPHLDQF